MNPLWYDRLSRRERVFLLLTVTLASLAGWYRLVWTPFVQAWTQVESRQADAARQRQALPAVGQPDAPWLADAHQWVPAQEVAGLLDRLTQKSSGLRLVGMVVRTPHRLVF